MHAGRGRHGLRDAEYVLSDVGIREQPERRSSWPTSPNDSLEDLDVGVDTGVAALRVEDGLSIDSNAAEKRRRLDLSVRS